MTLLDRVIAHNAETQARTQARHSVPVYVPGRNGPEFQVRRDNVPQFDNDTLLTIRPYFDPESGTIIQCMSQIDSTRQG